MACFRQDHFWISVVGGSKMSIFLCSLFSGAFFLCWGPYVCLNFWSVNNELQAVPYVADLLTTFLAFTNSSLNPVIFTALSKDFRMSTKCIVHRILCFWRKDMVFSFRHRQEWGSRYASIMESRTLRRRGGNSKVCVLDPEDSCVVDSETVSPACTVCTTDGVAVVLNPSTLPQSDVVIQKPHTPLTPVVQGESLPGAVS